MWKWRILFQLETEATEQLKSIILREQELTLKKFCDNMDYCIELAAEGIHIEGLPYLENEEHMNSIFHEIGLQEEVSAIELDRSGI